MEKIFTLASIGIFMAIFSGCQQRMFGVDEVTWSTLSEQEREKVIDGYNKRKEIELLTAQKWQEKHQDNERHRQEIEAQTAPIYAIAGAVSSICKNSETGMEDVVRIQSLSTKGKKILTIKDVQFEVSPFSKMSDAWLKGQKVELSKNECDAFYSVQIKNLDNGEYVIARKVKG